MICKNCGKEFEGNFCPECGTRIEQQEMTQCPNCGAERVDNGKFCVNCGYNFDDPTQSARVIERKPSGSNAKSNNFLKIFAKAYRWLLAGGMLFVGIVSLLCLTAPTITEDFFGETNPLCTGFVAIGNGSDIDVTKTVVNASVMLLVLSILALVYGVAQLFFAIKKPYSNTIGKKQYVFWGIDGVISIILIILGAAVSTEAKSDEFMDGKLGAGFAMCIVMGVFGLVCLGARIYYELKVFKWEDTGLSDEQIARATARKPRGEQGVTEKGIKWYLSKDGIMTIVGYSGASNDIVIPSTINGHSVTIIGNRAFYDCRRLTSIEIPSGVTSIANHAFYNCSSLTNVTFDDNSQLAEIGYNAFSSCSSLTSIEIPSGVTSIGYSAFSGCSSLISIRIPDGVKRISDWAFNECRSLTSIEIPSGVTSIGYWTFKYCGKLTNVTFGEDFQLTSIGEDAFYDCSSLKSIEIPSNVKSIGEYAFDYCSSLTIYCEAGSKPRGWSSNWNGNTPVVWGYKK